MTSQATAYRVLIASPSDVPDQRAEAANTANGLNSTLVVDFGAVLVPIMWETDSTPVMGERPQGAINRQIVDQSDILVGIFWTRLGTPTGEAASGTAEEIQRFLDQKKKVLLYFSNAHIPQDTDLEEFQRLKGFRESCKTRGLVDDFDSTDDLRTKVERHLRSTIRELQHGTDQAVVTGGQLTRDDGDERSIVVSQYRAFLIRYEAEWTSERDSGPRGIDDGKRILRDRQETR